MTRFTPLETAVLDALADELRFDIPDLPGQIAEALPGVRRNTGFGFFTEVIVDRNRPGVNIALSGRLGSIHGDVPGLVEPMAFQVEVAGGRLIALHGATYAERTDVIDFTTARVSGLFRIDEQGESIAWTPPVLTEDSPLRTLQRSDEPLPGLAQPSLWDGGSPHVARSRQLIEAEQNTPPPAVQAVFDALFGTSSSTAPQPPPATAEEQTSLVVGAVVLILVIGLFAVLFLDVPLLFVLIMGGYLISALMRPKGRAALRKAVNLYKAVRVSNGR